MANEIDFNALSFEALPNEARDRPLAFHGGPWDGREELLTVEQWRPGLGLECEEQFGGVVFQNAGDSPAYFATRQLVTGHYRIDRDAQGVFVLVWHPLADE